MTTAKHWRFLPIGALLVAALLSPFVLLQVWVWQNELPEPERDAFVTEFLESVRDGTDFHRGFLSENGQILASQVSDLLRDPYEILRWEGLLWDDECYVQLEDESVLLLYVVQSNRQVESVGLHRY